MERQEGGWASCSSSRLMFVGELSVFPLKLRMGKAAGKPNELSFGIETGSHITSSMPYHPLAPPLAPHHQHHPEIHPSSPQDTGEAASMRLGDSPCSGFSPHLAWLCFAHGKGISHSIPSRCPQGELRPHLLLGSLAAMASQAKEKILQRSTTPA